MSEIKVDTVAEKTSANGVTIDGLNIKDSKLVTANSIVEANITDGAISAAKLASGVGGITMADQWRLTANKTIGDTTSTFDANWERIDGTGQGTLSGGMTESSGIFSFPSTGIYLVSVNLGWGGVSALSTSDSRYFEFKIQATTNNSSYGFVSRMNGSLKYISNGTYQNLSCNSLIDVTDTSNVKVKFTAESQNDVRVSGSTTNNESNEFTFIRLGDT